MKCILEQKVLTDFGSTKVNTIDLTKEEAITFLKEGFLIKEQKIYSNSKRKLKNYLLKTKQEDILLNMIDEFNQSDYNDDFKNFIINRNNKFYKDIIKYDFYSVDLYEKQVLSYHKHELKILN